MYGIVPLVDPERPARLPQPAGARSPSRQGTDLAYINALAEKVGYVFYIDPGPLPGMNIAYWGPEIKIGHAAAGADASTWTARPTSSR